jgi:hypothetical protein
MSAADHQQVSVDHAADDSCGGIGRSDFHVMFGTDRKTLC